MEQNRSERKFPKEEELSVLALLEEDEDEEEEMSVLALLEEEELLLPPVCSGVEGIIVQTI